MGWGIYLAVVMIFLVIMWWNSSFWVGLANAVNITVLAGRIPVEDIIRMLQRMRFDLVIDATHPYATSITESICTACRETQTEYLRLLRQTTSAGVL